MHRLLNCPKNSPYFFCNVKFLTAIVLLSPLILVTFGSNLAYSGDAFYGMDSSIQKIEKAAKAKKVDKETAFQLKLDSIIEPKKLPSEFRSAPIKSATEELNDLFDETNVRNQLKKNGASSSLSDNRAINFSGMPYETIISYYGNSLGISGLNKSYISPANLNGVSHFKVWYTTSGPNAVSSADTDSNSIPDYVEKVGEYLEISWHQQINVLGFNEPPGSSQKYNVFLKDLGAQGFALGFTYAGGSGYSWPSFIVMENDFQGYPGEADHNIKITVSHEFFHAVTFGYNPFHTDYSGQNRWWAEATAVWIEDIVFPGTRPYIDYLFTNRNGSLSGWMSDPELSITHWGDMRQYGSSLFVQFLAEKKGKQTIRRIWNNLSGLDLAAKDKVISVIDQTLRSLQKGSFNSLYVNFISRNFNFGGYKDMSYITNKKNNTAVWSAYPYLVYSMNLNPYSSFPVIKTFDSGNYLPRYLGANYHVFNADTKGKTFFFKGMKNTARTIQPKWTARLLFRKKGTQSYVVRNLLTGERNEDFLKVKEFNGEIYDRAVLVASVLRPAGNSTRYTYSFWAKNIANSYLEISSAKVSPGTAVKFYGRISPAHPSMDNLYLQSRNSTSANWTNLAKLTWKSGFDKYYFTFKPQNTAYYRLYWKGDRDHGRTYSSSKKIYVE